MASVRRQAHIPFGGGIKQRRERECTVETRCGIIRIAYATETRSKFHPCDFRE